MDGILNWVRPILQLQKVLLIALFVVVFIKFSLNNFTLSLNNFTL